MPPDFTERARKFALGLDNYLSIVGEARLAAEFSAVWEESRKAGLLEEIEAVKRKDYWSPSDAIFAEQAIRAAMEKTT